ncbi:MAG: transketolase family protein, partial [Rubrobacteridae bacterium]|nr:transketolase family protein [Rubrobacteridae bacterium]
MIVIVPADFYEAKSAVKKAAEIDGPVYIRLGRATLPMIFDDSYEYELGKAIKLKEGTDVTILAAGIMVANSLNAAEELSKQGINAEVINVSTVKPLDENTIIESASKTGKVVVAEEHSIIGGLGSAIAELLGEKHPVPVVKVGIKDVFGRSGEPDELVEYYGLTGNDISQAVRSLLKL